MTRFICFCLLSFGHLAAAAEKTNVLFIYIEDLGYYTSERAAREPNSRIVGLETPNLDKLAAGSVNFTRTFCGQSVCSPSKGAILTGLLPHANGIWRNVFNADKAKRNPAQWIPLPAPLTPQNDPSNLGVGGIHEDLPTLIEKLKAQGVYCALSGKLHVQPARKFPYDRFFDEGDLDAVIAAAGEKPWFFWCNPGDTHAPWWKHVQAKLADPKDRNSAPKDVDPATLQMLPWLPDTPAARIDLAQYYSCVRNMDAFVGTMLAKLEASGQAGRTLLVVTGDHGIGYARGKTSVYPAGTHVPCFIKGPGVKTGRAISTPISQMDFNPTFLEAFGGEAEKVCHGKSLWPILSGKADALPGRSTIMTETNNSLMSAPGRKGDGTAARAVCDGRFYYIGNLIQQKVTLPEAEAIHVGSGDGEYGDPGPQYAIDLHDDTVRMKDTQPLPYELLRQLCMSDAPPEELYDLEADPWAVKNLIADPAHATTLARMRGEFADWRTFTKDAGIHPGKIPRRTSAAVLERDKNRASHPARKTAISIVGEAFHINGAPTYAGREWRGHRIEGLLMNSRMVQGIFDDRNAETAVRWTYPDTGKWDAERNTREFIAAMPEWKAHGLLAFTICLQGGSPEGYSKAQPWENSAFDPDGTLRADYMARLARILDRADDLGMAAIVGYFYFGQDQRLADEAAVLRATDNATKWLLDGGWRNVLVEVNNECNVAAYDHDILKPARIHELIARVRAAERDGRHLAAGTSYGGGAIPRENVVRVSDFLLLHGNGVKQPARIGEMVRQTRAAPGYRPMPIVFNEDDHFDFDQPENNFTSAIAAGASWGYFDLRMKGEGSADGYQSVPVQWGIVSPRKRAFFQLLAEITGSSR